MGVIQAMDMAVATVTIIPIPHIDLASHTVAPVSGLGFIVADEATAAEAIMADTVADIAADMEIEATAMDIVVMGVAEGMVTMVVMVIDDNTGKISMSDD